MKRYRSGAGNPPAVPGSSLGLGLTLSFAMPPAIVPLEAHYADFGDEKTACDRQKSGPGGVAYSTTDRRRVTCPGCLAKGGGGR